MNLEFREFSRDLGLEEQRELFFDCFPEHVNRPTGTLDHYEWKFHSFPADPPSYQYAAYADTTMVGYYAAIPYKYKIGDCLCTAGMVCDVMTSSRARGLGIFTRLGKHSLNELRENGIDFTTGYPIRPEVVPGHLKVGWKIVQRMPTFIKPVRSRSILKLKGLSFVSPLADIALSFYLRVTTLKRLPVNYVLELMNVQEFLNLRDYREFSQTWMRSVPHALIKDFDFLRWRLSAPTTEYQIIGVRSREGQLVGVCVCRETELSHVPTLAVIDIMLLPKHYDAFSVFDYALVRLAQARKAEIIASMMSNLWAKRYGLYRRGYLKSPYVFQLIIRKLNSELVDKDLFNPDNWHVMWMDSDDL